MREWCGAAATADRRTASESTGRTAMPSETASGLSCLTLRSALRSRPTVSAPPTPRQAMPQVLTEAAQTFPMAVTRTTKLIALHRTACTAWAKRKDDSPSVFNRLSRNCRWAVADCRTSVVPPGQSKDQTDDRGGALFGIVNGRSGIHLPRGERDGDSLHVGTSG